MKRSWLVFAIYTAMAGCERSSSPTSVPNGEPKAFQDEKTSLPAQSPTLRSENSAVSAKLIVKNEEEKLESVTLEESQVRDLLQKRTEDGFLTETAWKELQKIVPTVEDPKLFWRTLGAIPSPQIRPFREAILKHLQMLEPSHAVPLSSMLQEAYRTAGKLDDPEVARIAWKKFPLARPYQFPITTPEGWPSGLEFPDRYFHGEQGLLASAVVQFGDAASLREYREKLVSAAADTQRTMIWALGRSTREEDFDYLMGLRAKIEDPKILDTLNRSLNRIPVSMGLRGGEAGITPAERERLTLSASKCKERLIQEGLVLELSVYD